MIDLILGGLGSGKNSYATYKLFLNMLQNEYIGYSNYNIVWKNPKGELVYKDKIVYPFESINDFDKMVDGMKYLVLDEFYRTSHSRRSGQQIALDSTIQVAQSRKRDCDIAFLSQRGGKLDLDIRDVADFIHRPQIMTRRCNICGYYSTNKAFGMLVICPQCKSKREGKPIILKVESVWREKPLKVKKTYVNLVNETMNIDIPESYNTREVIDALDNSMKEKKEKIVEKYRNVCDNEKELTAIIWKNEGLKIGECSLIARLALSK